MNEIVEMIYQWHQGQSILEVSRSLGFDRKTIRRYVKIAEKTGLKRGDPFPDEQALLGHIRALSVPKPTYEAVRELNFVKTSYNNYKYLQVKNDPKKLFSDSLL